jgi:methionyl-tRNA formyltransferase
VRLVYLGTPDMAVPPLRALHGAGHEVALVVSGADKRRGRGGRTSPSPVKAAAVELGLPVTADPDDVLGVEADLGVVVAYGRIIRPHVLDHLRMVNLHFSLLPRWRGAAPVERAILAGDDRTGVCVMDVEEALDTGGVHARAEIPVDDEVTAAELRARLVELGCGLLLDTLAAGLGTAEPQATDGVTYAEKLRPEEFELHWDRPAVQVHRTVRVGGAWTTFRGRRLKVLSAQRAPADVDAPAPGAFGSGPGGPIVGCGDGVALELVEVQPEGKGPMAAAAWANGARPAADERLGM